MVYIVSDSRVFEVGHGFIVPVTLEPRNKI